MNFTKYKFLNHALQTFTNFVEEHVYVYICIDITNQLVPESDVIDVEACCNLNKIECEILLLFGKPTRFLQNSKTNSKFTHGLILKYT